MGAAASIETKINFTYEDLQSLNFCKVIPNCHEKTIALYACNFPETLNTRVLQFIISFLNDGEAYSIIYFHGGIKNRPSLGWVTEAYRQIDYNHRKKLQNLYIVHPTLWVRSVTALMKAVVSEKVWRKIVTITQLQKLNDHIPISRFRETIPKQVFDTDNENKNINKSGNGGEISELPQFSHIGLTVDALKKRDANKLILFNSCVKFLAVHGPNVEGIFRINPDRSKMFAILESLEKTNIINFNFVNGSNNLEEASKVVELNYFDKNNVFIVDNVHIVSGILKLFLKELPDSLIGNRHFEVLVEHGGNLQSSTTATSSAKTENSFQKVLKILNKESLQLLKLFNNISKNSSKNKMSAKAIAICFAPVFCGHENTIYLHQNIHKLVEVYTELIADFEHVFQEDDCDGDMSGKSRESMFEGRVRKGKMSEKL